MIVTGKITSKDTSTNLYKVKLDLTEVPINTDSLTLDCNISSTSALANEYNVDDKVYVDFIHDKLSTPLILGLVDKIGTADLSNYATQDYVTDKIASAITSTLSTAI